MSQNDFNLANQGFPAMRADMNSAFQALASNSSGATEPGTTYAYQWWYDTNNDILKMRNADDDAWINIASFDQANDTWSPYIGSAQLTATADELNILDGVTATTAELNLLDGITALSGSDTEIVTGTAGTDGQIGTWNADGDLIGVGTNTANGDVVVLEDVSGSPGLPAVDGSQLTNLSGGMTVTTTTLSADADCELTWTGTPKLVEIRLREVKCSNDAQGILMEFSDDAGSTYKSTGYDYIFTPRYGSNQGGINHSVTASNIPITSLNASTVAPGNALGENGVSGTVSIWKPNQAAWTIAKFGTVYIEQNGNLGAADGYGQLTTTDAINGVKLSFQSGNMTGAVDLVIHE